MHKFFLKITLSFIVFFNVQAEIDPSCSTAITYQKWGGRFGDNVYNYAKSRLLAWENGTDFLYQPFLFSNQLKMHILEKPLNSSEISFKRKTSRLHDRISHPLKKDKSIIYETTFGLVKPEWYDFETFLLACHKNPKFYAELKKMLEPIEPLSLPKLPENMINVAVHVRKGGGFDSPLLSGSNLKEPADRYTFADVKNPFKFPPEEFYLSQLKHISELANNAPMYVYIFTDEKYPEKIAQRFAELIQKPNIQFDHREVRNHMNDGILFDLYHMAQFDYLIRPQSSFSHIAQLVGNHKLVIFPKLYHWEGTTMVVDTVGLIMRKRNGIKIIWEYLTNA